MDKKWTRHDVVDGYQVDYRFTGDVLEIILLEHMTPIYCWEIEEYSGCMYRVDEAITDPVDQDNATIMIKWVEDQIGDCSLCDIISGLVNNPDQFEAAPNNNMVKYVCDFTDGFYSILTYRTSTDRLTQHLNVMFFEGDSRLGWVEFWGDGSQGRSDRTTYKLSIPLAMMEKALCSTIRRMGVVKFMSCVESGEDLTNILILELPIRDGHNLKLTFTKVEQK